MLGESTCGKCKQVATEWEGGNDLDEALRELRADRQAAQEELEETSRLIERAERSLDEVALDFLYRGDSLRVTVGARSWTGIVVHVGVEVMTLQTPGGTEVDLAYEGLTSMRVVERARGGGRSRTSKHPGELIARLRELENTEEVVEVGGRNLAPVEGKVEVVARGHIEVCSRQGAEWILPLGEIGYVIRAGGRER